MSPKMINKGAISKIRALAAEGKSAREIGLTLTIPTRRVYDIGKRNNIEFVNKRTNTPRICPMWHERLKSGDPESIFTDPDFIAENIGGAKECYDYKKLKGLDR